MGWKNIRSNEEGMEVLASIPNLDKRVKNFLAILEEEPCSHDMVRKISIRPCDVLSNSQAMCPACRLRLRFFHSVFNAGAYDPSLDDA